MVFLDYTSVSFSASGDNDITITTLGYKAFVTVEISSISNVTDKGYIKGGNIYILKSGSGDATSGVAVGSGAVFPSGTSITLDDYDSISGKLHIFRLPEAP